MGFRQLQRFFQPFWLLGGTALGVGIGIGVGLWILLFQPLWALTSVSPLICPNAVYAVDTDRPVVALTLDDGPDLSTSLNSQSQNTTAQILELLKQHQATATFFLISRKLKTPLGETLAQRIVQGGHELGNHFTEDVRSINVNKADFQQNVWEAEQTLSTWAKPQWFRPAGGWCSRSNAQTTATRYPTALGTVWPYDTHLPFVSFAAWQILQAVHPGDIIILHDGGKTNGESDRGQRTVQILHQVLPALRTKGYQIVSLSELVTYGPTVQNSLMLPPCLDRIRQRLVAGWIVSSLTTVPAVKDWGVIGLISLAGAIALLGIGFHYQFLHYQWASPPLPCSKMRWYGRVLLFTFFLPAMVEECLFRLILLPSPREITNLLTPGQWLECAVSLTLFIVVHPCLNGPLRDRVNPRHAGQQDPNLTYGTTFRRPTFLVLASIVGLSCTVLYLQTRSIWPPILFHWIVVATWLLSLDGYQTLHHPRS